LEAEVGVASAGIRAPEVTGERSALTPRVK
jgi:hypothetical protein